MNKVNLGAQFVPRSSFNLPELVLLNRKGSTHYLRLTCLRFMPSAKVEPIDADDVVEQQAAALVGP